MLVGGALVSGLARRSFLSLTAVFVVAGFALGKGGLDVLHFDARSGFVDGLGLVYGLVLGFVGSLLMPRPGGLERAEIPAHQKSLYALGCAFAIYGLTVLKPHGNGLIAVYVGAIVLGIRRPDLRTAFEQR